MSYRKEYLEWDITEDQLLYNTPVGFEVEFSQTPLFYPILYKISSCDYDMGEILTGRFYYSLDEGATWLDFPIGEATMAFTQPYKMRLCVTVNETGYIYVQRNQTIYRITGDGVSVIDSYEINENVSCDLEIQKNDDIICVLGSNTLYRISMGESIAPYYNSLSLNNSPNSVAVDSSRDLLWELGDEKIYLKNIHGEIIFCVENPVYKCST